MGRCSFAVVVPRVRNWIEEKPKREACGQVVNVHHLHTKAQPIQATFVNSQTHVKKF